MSGRATVVFGVANLATALLVGAGVFVCLPARWAPVDLVAGLVTVLELTSGIGLLARARWASGVARAAGALTLVVGLGLVTTLAVTASWLSGVYGPVGAGGGLILALVAALAVPYLVVLPCVELVWIGARPPPRPGA
jgi:hypothetical protein